VRWGGQALRKGKNGRYAAKPTDRLLRPLLILDHGGRREIAVLDSRQGSLLGKYWNAVHRYLDTGDALALRKFQGEHITDANGTKHLLLTDLAELERQGNAGEFS